MSQSDTAYHLYKTHKAVSLHFESASYDYTKYKGKTKVTPQMFEKSRDRSRFYRLAGFLDKQDALGFMVSNGRDRSIKWIGEIDFDQGRKIYNEWVRTMSNMRRIFKTDAKKLVESASPSEWTKIPEGGTYPLMCQLAMDEDIAIETVVILGKILDCVPDLKATEDMYWPVWHKRFAKYGAFLKPDVRDYAKLLREVMNDQAAFSLT